VESLAIDNSAVESLPVDIKPSLLFKSKFISPEVSRASVPKSHDVPELNQSLSRLMKPHQITAEKFALEKLNGFHTNPSFFTAFGCTSSEQNDCSYNGAVIADEFRQRTVCLHEFYMIICRWAWERV
jgi:hypothetical protein